MKKIVIVCVFSMFLMSGVSFGKDNRESQESFVERSDRWYRAEEQQVIIVQPSQHNERPRNPGVQPIRDQDKMYQDIQKSLQKTK